MYWQETTEQRRYVVPDDVVDVAFAISCRALPVDHAWALSEAVTAVLPWMVEDPRAGVHTIHVADSGNGWMRPQAPDDLLYLSRRTRLVLRVPRERIDDTHSLSGKTLDVASQRLQVDRGTVRLLSEVTTIFARYIVTEDDDSESAFLVTMDAQLKRLGIRPKKMLCGIERAVQAPGHRIRTRSLMLADLTVEESVRLQQEGLGPLRHRGCGLFIPHKGIHEVHQTFD
jgi:CRISPR-associated protein Cas6